MGWREEQQLWEVNQEGNLAQIEVLIFRKKTNFNNNSADNTMNGFNRSGLRTSGGTSTDPALGEEHSANVF